MTMTAPIASGPISSRAYETPASAMTAAARPSRIRSVGDSDGRRRADGPGRGGRAGVLHGRKASRADRRGDAGAPCPCYRERGAGPHRAGRRRVDELLTRLAEAAASVSGAETDQTRAIAVSIHPSGSSPACCSGTRPTDGLGVTADVVRALATDLQAAGVPATVTSDPGVAPLVPSDEL